MGDMEVLGQLGDKVYVADPDGDVLYATRPPDETAELVGDGRVRPEQFLKFNGAYLTDLADDRDEDDIIAAVETAADPDAAPPLGNTGTPPPEGAPTRVAGLFRHDDGSRTRILTGDPGQLTDSMSVWVEGNPDIVATVADVERSYVAEWFEDPPPA